MSNIDYTQICPEFYTNYEDGCCMENCTFESKGYCPVQYVKGLLEEKDKVIEQLEKENKVNVKELATMFNTKIINDNGELKKQIKELPKQIVNRIKQSIPELMAYVYDFDWEHFNRYLDGLLKEYQGDDEK